MRLRKIIRDYFTFSKKERNGIIVLLMLVVLMAVANQLIFLFEKPDNADIGNFLAEVSEFEKQQSIHRKSFSLFEFDPNTIDSLAIDSLQIPIQVKRNLLRFRKKGGRFFNPVDFKKLYGMNDSVFSSVQEFIRIERREGKADELKTVQHKTEFFAFNPNEMNDGDWFRLGMTEKQIQLINRYKQSLGGQFTSKEQFGKTFGISSELMDSLLKYIQIQPQVNKAINHELEEKAKIELNSADTILLKKLPGIGSVLSKRIVKYRDALGGFYSAKQLLEVYGLNPETYLKIENQLEIDTLLIRKIDINFSSFEDLARHPYVGKNLGREILNFRSKNGKIRYTSVLLNERLINADKYEKIRHYIGTKND